MTRQYKDIFKQLSSLLLVYAGLRFLFLIFNYKIFAPQSLSSLLQAFVYGMRFDLSTILLLNGLIIALMAMPPWRASAKIVTQLTRGLFVTLNSIFLLPSIIDIEYFKFSGSRMTWDILLFRGEAAHQLDQFLINYWYILAIAVIGITIIWQLRTLIEPRLAHDNLIQSLSLYGPLWIICLIMIVIGARGGLQRKPIQTAHAYTLGNTDLGLLTLNSGFTILHSQLKPQLTPAHFFATDEEAFQFLPPQQIKASGVGRGQNVVIIILESLASEFWGATNPEESYTPFLDELVKQGSLFKYNFANGRRSIEALPAVLFGIPAYMSTPIIKSSYQSGNWLGLGTILEGLGYHTSFFHGAPRGTMYFDAISGRAGMRDYYPKERYQGNLSKDFDGNWGIYDEPMLQYMANELDKHKQPFFSVVFTISTHQPYVVPLEFADKLPKGSLQIHQSVRYVDLALRKFFETAKTKSWYHNTLFVMTADHTQMSNSRLFSHIMGRYRVPLFFFHPTQILPSTDPNRVTQHTDIYSSVLDYLGAPTDRLPRFGRSVFDSTREGTAMFLSQESYFYVQGQRFIEFTEGKGSQLYVFPEDMEQISPLINESDKKNQLELELQAQLQYFRNGLINNKIY